MNHGTILSDAFVSLGLDVDDVESAPEPMATDAPPVEAAPSSAMEEID
jgi:hypothetical protein